jgi:hypothetical protein
MNAGFLCLTKHGERQIIPNALEALGKARGRSMLPDKHYYLSAYTFDLTHLDAWKRTHDGSLAGMAGNVDCRPLWITWDIDLGRSESIIHARKLVDVLTERYSAGCVMVNLSGSKGVHIRLRLGGPEGGKRLPAITKRFAEAVGRLAGVPIDSSIYDISRIIRLPNVLHESSGLYAIPITVGELQLESPDELWAKATRQRFMPMDWWPASGSILADWQGAVDADAATVAKPRANSSEPRVRLNMAVEDVLAKGLGTDGRKLKLFRSAANMGELPTRESLIHAVLLPIARHAGLDDRTALKQITDGIKTGTRAAGLDTSNDWEYPCDDEPDSVQEAK